MNIYQGTKTSEIPRQRPLIPSLKFKDLNTLTQASRKAAFESQKIILLCLQALTPESISSKRPQSSSSDFRLATSTFGQKQHPILPHQRSHHINSFRQNLQRYVYLYNFEHFFAANSPTHQLQIFTTSKNGTPHSPLGSTFPPLNPRSHPTQQPLRLYDQVPLKDQPPTIRSLRQTRVSALY